jgi:DNA-nicking Smr family endonuclease
VRSQETIKEIHYNPKTRTNLPMPKPSEATKKILEYIDRHGVRDKDALASTGRKQQSKSAPQKSGKRRFRKTLDLHGMTTGIAIAALRTAIDECAKRGIAELLVIHGYGLHSAPAEGAVLKTAVRQYLEGKNDPGIRSFTMAASKDGGEGATLVRFQ